MLKVIEPKTRARGRPRIEGCLCFSLASLVFVFGPVDAADAATPPAVTAYGGKYFHDTVGGYRFFTNPAVVRAISSAVTDPAARREILSLETRGVTEPIAVSNGAATASACLPQHCDSTNFVIYVSTNLPAAAVCWMNPQVGLAKSRWYLTGSPPKVRSGSCPDDSAPPPRDILNVLTGEK